MPNSYTYSQNFPERVYGVTKLRFYWSYLNENMF